MKVRDLVEEINRCQEEFPDFMDWDVYTEQIDEKDKEYKKCEQKWDWVTDSEEWEYFECAGFFTKFPDRKIFTINVNY